MKAYIQLIRPKDWAKNSFLFIPLFFAGEIFNKEILLQELIGVPPAGIRFLGADRYGFDIERAGRRERQRFSDGPISVDDIGSAVRRILSVI